MEDFGGNEKVCTFALAFGNEPRRRPGEKLSEVKNFGGSEILRNFAEPFGLTRSAPPAEGDGAPQGRRGPSGKRKPRAH